MSRTRFLLSVLAAATLASCGSNSTSLTSPTGGGTLSGSSVSIVFGAQNKGTAAFTPNPVSVSLATTGGLVEWINNDETGGGNGTTHNITADDESFSSGNLVPGATFGQTFTVAGTYPYHCSIHPTMKGTVTVTP